MNTLKSFFVPGSALPWFRSISSRRGALFALAIFLALAFVPVMKFPNDLVPVWAAYVIFVLGIHAGYWADLGLACGLVIIAHITLSLVFGALLGRVFGKQSKPKATGPLSL